MRIGVLGPLVAESADGAPITVGGARLRMLLVRLVLTPGRQVSADALIEALWGAEPPADAPNALQSLVSRLRRALGDPATITSGPGGYRLATVPDDVDLPRFEKLLAEGRRALAEGRVGEAEMTLGAALALWRGDPLADVADAPFAQAEIARLTELKAGAEEDFFAAALRGGRHAEVLADLEAAGERHPLRERLAELRMRALSATGRQSDALAVYDRVRARLADELGVDPSSALQDAHLAVLRGETAPRPKPAHVPSLPGWLTSFIGRDTELTTLARLLEESRLVTITGPGGAGKTRLATEVATRHPAHATGRVWFVPLAGTRDPADLTGAVLSAFGGRDRWLGDAMPGQADELDRVTELLAGGPALLVLDNCEHVVAAAAALVHELLLRLPALRVLATSREPLAIDGETGYPLGPLAMPDSGDDPAEAASVRLFADRARAVRPGFRLHDDNLRAVAEICRRLDGMPLALELAAARLRSMSPAQIEQRLDDRFRLLTSGSRIALPRQRTLRAVVEWSWDLLEKPERLLAARLAIFPAGATVEAVEAVCADDRVPADDIVYILGSLVEKSIVDVQTPDGGGETRYRMLETIRAYAAGQLASTGERSTVAAAFVRYFRDLAVTTAPKIRGRGQLAAIAILDREQENLLAALRIAIDDRQIENAYRLGFQLFWYWMMKGHHQQVYAYVTEVAAFGAELPDDVRAGLAVVSALTSFGSGVTDSRTLIEDFTRTGAERRLPELAMALPMLAFMGGHRDLVDRELARVLASDDPWVRACGHWANSFDRRERGDLAGARIAQQTALEQFTALGDRWGIALVLGMVAQDRSVDGDHQGAIAAYREGLALALELDSAEDIVQHRWRIATELMRSGELSAARRELELAAEQAANGNDIQIDVMVLLGRVELARTEGELAQAWRMVAELETALAAWPFGDRTPREWLATVKASLALAEGDTVRARAELAVSLSSASERRDMPDVSKAGELVAALLAAEGELAGAARALGLSVAVRGTLDHGSPEVRALVDRLTADLGKETYAQHYLTGTEMSTKDAIVELQRLLDGG